MKFPIEKYKYFEYVFSLKQNAMKQFIYNELLHFYKNKNIHYSNDYIYVEGSIPIALVAHMDTVWEENPPQYILFDPFKNVMWSPHGLGADDRAGCIAILEILKNSDLRPHLIFTTDEEIGGLGAEILAELDCPFDDLRYIIELDRRGRNDCVFYDCESEDFQKYIETFGFKTAIGTFSDISLLCGAWEICGVNLSIGYMNEHTTHEMLFLNAMYNTITRVMKMLSVTDIPKYKWEGLTYLPIDFDWMDNMEVSSRFFEGPALVCKGCHRPVDGAYAIHAIPQEGTSAAIYCYNCMTKHVSYCPRCSQPIENPEGIESEKLCRYCSEVKKDETPIF